jgi:hypothetical protein
MRKFILLVILIFVLPEAQAISFGSLQTVKNIDLSPHQEKKRKFWFGILERKNSI